MPIAGRALFLATPERSEAAGVVMTNDVRTLPFGAVATHAAVQELVDIVKTCR